jgi:hypothetical protein
MPNKTLSNKSFQELRKVLDGSDPFMTGGHGIRKPNSRRKKIPDWALNDVSVKEILIRSFPKLQTNLRQRKSAAKWVRVIHLYYRAGMTRGQVATEMGIKDNALKRTLISIKRVAAGRWTDNKGRFGGKKGRPKSAVPLVAPMGEIISTPRSSV